MKRWLIAGTLLVSLTLIARGRAQDPPDAGTPAPPRPRITSPSDRPPPSSTSEHETPDDEDAAVKKSCHAPCTIYRPWRRCLNWRPLRLFRCR